MPLLRQPGIMAGKAVFFTGAGVFKGKDVGGWMLGDG